MSRRRYPGGISEYDVWPTLAQHIFGLENSSDILLTEDFSKPKIVYPETTQGAYFAFDNSGIMLDKTCFMLIAEDAVYIQRTLSSKLFEFAYKTIFSSVELGKSGYQYNKHALVKLPILLPNPAEQKMVVECSINTLDNMIYSLYNLENEEVCYINEY